MICKLCQKEENLIKAHIIPDFMYKDIYDEKHLFHKLHLSDRSKDSKIPTGEYDSQILCANCDNSIIGKLESYAAEIFETGGSARSAVLHYKDIGADVLHTKDIEYTKFKLFLLSILWRSSITTREFFRNINLGPYENVIRDMLYHQDPKDHADFPVVLMAIRHDVPWTSQLILEPDGIKIDNITWYRFFINGIMFFYIVGENLNKLNPFILDTIINKSNEMKIIFVQDGQGETLLKSYMFKGIR
jgi:hypothetical protein